MSFFFRSFSRSFLLLLALIWDRDSNEWVAKIHVSQQIFLQMLPILLNQLLSQLFRCQKLWEVCASPILALLWDRDSNEWVVKIHVCQRIFLQMLPIFIESADVSHLKKLWEECASPRKCFLVFVIPSLLSLIWE